MFFLSKKHGQNFVVGHTARIIGYPTEISVSAYLVVDNTSSDLSLRLTLNEFAILRQILDLWRT